MRPIALEHRAESLRTLAALLRLGYPVRAALMEWENHAPDVVRPTLAPVRGLIALGLPTPAALRRLQAAFEQDAVILASLLKISGKLGGDSSAMVESLASAVETRRASASLARSASSGAKLSGRLVAALPLAFLPLFPMSRDHLLSGSNRFSLIAGVGLLLVGLMWIARLVPRPHLVDDPAAALADMLAAVLRGGGELAQSLDAISQSPPQGLESGLHRARRIARLGLPWPEALARTGDSALASLGSTLDRSHRLGVAVADSLGAFARVRRTERDREFETKNKRATVFMLIPLAVCVLPAFIFLAIAPFLRGLSLL